MKKFPPEASEEMRAYPCASVWQKGACCTWGLGWKKKEFHNNNNNNKTANKRKTRQKEKQHSWRATARHFYSPGETSSISLKQLYIERNASSKSRFMLMPRCREMECLRHVSVFYLEHRKKKASYCARSQFFGSLIHAAADHPFLTRSLLNTLRAHPLYLFMNLIHHRQLITLCVISALGWIGMFRE